MNPDWEKQLRAEGAILENGQVAHFGNPAAELRATADGAIVADLSHVGVLVFSGEDSLTFLQGQATSDIRQVTPAQAQLGTLCTHQGRMLANFLLWHGVDGYRMALPLALCVPIQQRLSKYLLRSRVVIRDVSDETVRLGVAGGAAEPCLRDFFGDVPTLDFGVTSGAHGTLIRLPGARFQIVATPSQAFAAWRALRAGGVSPVGVACWEWHTLRAGVPTILPATQEQFTPQMANLELLGAVSFTKGCYTGQEVVARTQHLGKVKRRLYLAHAASDDAPQAGDDVLDGSRETAGTVVNAQAAPGGGFDLLAVLTTHSAEIGNLQLATGSALTLLPLPYEVPQ